MAWYSTEQWVQWLDRLADQEYVIMDSFLPEELLEAVLRILHEQQTLQTWQPAKVGNAQQEERVSEIRSDFTYWLDRERDTGARPFFDLVGELMDQLAQQLFLSLRGFEFHLAKYPKGGFYKPHLDQFDSRSNRMISLVIYLNDRWQVGDGGELCIHGTGEPLRVAPLMNRAVLFRSDTVLHEVLPAQAVRYSLTGWLLKQPSALGVLGL